MRDAPAPPSFSLSSASSASSAARARVTATWSRASAPSAFVAIALAALAAVGCDEKTSQREKVDTAGGQATAAATQAAMPAASAPPPAASTPPAKAKRTCVPADTVDFAGNAMLEAEVRKKLQKPEGAIAPQELKTIKSLNLTAGPVDDLDPCIMPMFTGLKDLFLGPGELNDLSPIAGLDLVSLRASINKVADLRPLEKMTKMDRLDLGRTAVRDITPLRTLVNLTELQLDDTMVDDIAPLDKLTKLERVSLKNTPVKSLEPLRGHKKLRFLYIGGTTITDISPVQPQVQSGLKIVRD